MRLTRPELTFNYNPRLLIRAVIRMEMTGKMPTPEEVASVNETWENDVYAARDWLRFHQDWHKRPSDLK